MQGSSVLRQNISSMLLKCNSDPDYDVTFISVFRNNPVFDFLYNLRIVMSLYSCNCVLQLCIQYTSNILYLAGSS